MGVAGSPPMVMLGCSWMLYCTLLPNGGLQRLFNNNVHNFTTVNILQYSNYSNQKQILEEGILVSALKYCAIII